MQTTITTSNYTIFAIGARTAMRALISLVYSTQLFCHAQLLTATEHLLSPNTLHLPISQEPNTSPH